MSQRVSEIRIQNVTKVLKQYAGALVEEGDVTMADIATDMGTLSHWLQPNTGTVTLPDMRHAMELCANGETHWIYNCNETYRHLTPAP